MKAILSDYILKDTFFTKRLLYFIFGLLIGAFYGFILSFPAVLSYATFVYEFIGKEATRVGYGMVIGISFASIGSGLFFMLFGDLENNKSKILLGTLGGVFLGLYAGYMCLDPYYGNSKSWYIFILYGVTLGTIGSFFIAKHSKFYCNKINQLEAIVLQRITILILIFMILIAISQYPIFSKLYSLFDDNSINTYSNFFTRLFYLIF